MIGRIGRRGVRAGVALVSFLLAAAPVGAQVVPARARALSLEEALRLAEESSEQVAIARAGVTRSRGEQKRTRSDYFPQVFASAGYTRTLESEFSGLGTDIEVGGPDTMRTGPSAPCGTFTPNPALPLDQRVDSLEAAVACDSTANPFASFGDLPFGREHQYNLSLSVSHTVFSGGRRGQQNRIANAGWRSAEVELTSSRAQLALDVTQAYYDALLSDRLFAISQVTLAQADTTLDQVRLAFNVGNQAEFEVLRAQVTYETQQPLVIQRESQRTLAYMRLKQVLDLPLDVPLELTSELEEEELVPVATVAEVLDLPLDTGVVARAPVRQAANAVDIQAASLAIAKSQRLPSVTVSTQYGRVAYPSNVFEDFGDLRTNWTVSASLQVPIFTGGRIAGDEMVARADLDEARARLELTEELAALDTRSTLERLEAAEATLRATTGTVEQAQRAYAIAEVRFQEGISTQLELSDARIQLEQARANRAQATRDVQVERVRVALLPYLPLSPMVAPNAAAGVGAQPPVQMQPPQTQVIQAAGRSGAASAAGAGFSGLVPVLNQTGQSGVRNRQ